ncbi:hypothetical protein C8Q79DRAFT_692040 [Trametes meyenii]|nr:hypothetical protein C8Q79DRAFT_692040 [Trametes meyenii]
MLCSWTDWAGRSGTWKGRLPSRIRSTRPNPNRLCWARTLPGLARRSIAAVSRASRPTLPLRVHARRPLPVRTGPPPRPCASPSATQTTALRRGPQPAVPPSLLRTRRPTCVHPPRQSLLASPTSRAISPPTVPVTVPRDPSVDSPESRCRCRESEPKPKHGYMPISRPRRIQTQRVSKCKHQPVLMRAGDPQAYVHPSLRVLSAHTADAPIARPHSPLAAALSAFSPLILSARAFLAILARSSSPDAFPPPSASSSSRPPRPPHPSPTVCSLPPLSTASCAPASSPATRLHHPRRVRLWRPACFLTHPIAARARRARTRRTRFLP